MRPHLHSRKLSSQAPAKAGPDHLCSCKDCHIDSWKTWYWLCLETPDSLVAGEPPQPGSVQLRLCTMQRHWKTFCPNSGSPAPSSPPSGGCPGRKPHPERRQTSPYRCVQSKGNSKSAMRDCSLMPFGWEIVRFSPSLPLGFSWA